MNEAKISSKDSNMGLLYLVATPIGNMEDITLRAIKVLGEVDYIACEDTRKTGILLRAISNMYNKLVYYTQGKVFRKPQLISYYEQNERQRIPQIISLLKEGKSVALVSNAGTPTLSDPGFKLVRECVKEGIRVISIPGPSAILTALTSSGLPTDKFLFLGYLPKKQGKRKSMFFDLFHCFKTLKQTHPTIVFFEAPHRLIESLTDLKEVFGDIEIVIGRELTKLHEEIRREKISQSLEHFAQTPPRGEFTISFNIPQG